MSIRRTVVICILLLAGAFLWLLIAEFNKQAYLDAEMNFQRIREAKQHSECLYGASGQSESVRFTSWIDLSLRNDFCKSLSSVRPTDYSGLPDLEIIARESVLQAKKAAERAGAAAKAAAKEAADASSLARKYPSNRERDAIQAQLKSVPARYKIPDTLMYKQTAPVSFILEIEGKGSGARRIAELPGHAIEAQVDIARFVRVKLTGPPDMVKITLRGGEVAERQYAPFKNVSWIWDVEGLQVGRVDLNLELSAEVRIENRPEPLQVKTWQKTIDVQISYMDAAKEWAADVMSFWPFLTAVGTAGVGLVTFFGIKKRKPNENPFPK